MTSNSSFPRISPWEHVCDLEDAGLLLSCGRGEGVRSEGRQQAGTWILDPRVQLPPRAQAAHTPHPDKASS